MTAGYRVPTGPARCEIEVSQSRFIASLSPAQTADEARAFLHSVRVEFPDATHHVYAFRAGFPPSVTEGMSDAGEPAGTAGPPVLAVVRGSGAGDLVVVVTRYFGGTKLGTGGLVRAYTQAAQEVLAGTAFEEKRDMVTASIDMPYALFGSSRRAVEAEGGEIIDQTFGTCVTLVLRIERSAFAGLRLVLADLSAGSLSLVILD
jgi:uncharacterized YigZ family protein